MIKAGACSRFTWEQWLPGKCERWNTVDWHAFFS
jgi:hypothetical protein